MWGGNVNIAKTPPSGISVSRRKITRVVSLEVWGFVWVKVKVKRWVMG